jgi:putative ABC transport system permease protein
MNLRTCTVREVQRRPARTLLTLLGTALGLATVVAVGLTVPTVRRGYRELFDAATGGTALEVTAAGLAPFDPAPIMEAAEGVTGVEDVEPRIRAAAGVVGRAGSVTVPLLGITSGRQAALGRMRRGEAMAGEGDALLDDALATTLGLEPGELFRLWTSAGLNELRLSGTVAPRGATGAGGLLVVSLDTAGRLAALPPGQVNCLRVAVADGTAVEPVRSRLAETMPAGLTVHPPGSGGAQARATLLAAEQGLFALCAVALVTAGFVIFNTFLLNLGERRGQLALLKTLGATGGQVFRLLLGEALLLGVAGTVAGCLLGAALAVVLLRTMERFLGVALPGIEPAGGPFLLAGLLGPLTPLVAACLPAWQVSRRPPLKALTGSSQMREAGPWRFGAAGALLLVPGLILAVGVCRGAFAAHLCPSVLPLALVLLLAGGALAVGLLLGPFFRLLRFVPLGLVGGLALQQLDRHRGRTALTAGVLFLALAVAVGFGQSLRGILDDLHSWYRKTIVADFLVRGAMPDTSFTLAVAVPDALAGELAALEGVAEVDRIAFLSAEAAGRDVLVLARTFRRGGPLPLDLHEGDPEEVRSGLLRGEAVLGTGLAGQLGLHAGDSIALSTPGGPVPLRVAGTAVEFAGGGAALYLEWAAAARLLAVPGPHVLLVSARPGAARALEGPLKAFCARRRLLVQVNAELREQIEASLHRVTGAIWALLGLIFLVASLGIVNTLHMNIQDQMRTFALLRALGLKGGEVGRLVLSEALLLGGLTLLPGALAGVGLAFVISRGSAAASGMAITFRLDGPAIAGACGIALASALLAALAPARRAARLCVVEALG